MYTGKLNSPPSAPLSSILRLNFPFLRLQVSGMQDVKIEAFLTEIQPQQLLVPQTASSTSLPNLSRTNPRTCPNMIQCRSPTFSECRKPMFNPSISQVCFSPRRVMPYLRFGIGLIGPRLIKLSGEITCHLGSMLLIFEEATRSWNSEGLSGPTSFLPDISIYM